ncbi:uncharacterized protein LOC100902116 [Galendromus occidentalis]|uniref:Uncharacterized protein LOC100902116 n=1 Tax=Galendromus occidentalis TaxID=34638 RepID=A0AAJ6VWS7_9ACAR|nr:uncharacterized protein LOC100902116 [Galendromus occidentalis]
MRVALQFLLCVSSAWQAPALLNLTSLGFDTKPMRHDFATIQKLAAKLCIRNHDPVHFRNTAKECHDCALKWHNKMFELEEEDKLIHRIMYDCTQYFNMTHFLLSKCSAQRNHGFHPLNLIRRHRTTAQCEQCFVSAGLNLTASITFDEYVKARRLCVRTGTSFRTMATVFRGRSFRDIRYQYDYELIRGNHLQYCSDHFRPETVLMCQTCINDTFLSEDMEPYTALSKLRSCLPELNANERLALTCREADLRNRIIRFNRRNVEASERRRRENWESVFPGKPYQGPNVTRTEYNMKSLAECRSCFANENLGENATKAQKQAASYRCTPPLHPKLEIRIKLCNKVAALRAVKYQGHPNKQAGTLNERRHYGNRTYYFAQRAKRSCDACVTNSPVNINSTYEQYKASFKSCAENVVSTFNSACMDLVVLGARKQCTQCVTNTLGKILDTIATDRKTFLQATQCVLDAQDMNLLNNEDVLQNADANEVNSAPIVSPALGADENNGGGSIKFALDDR